MANQQHTHVQKTKECRGEAGLPARGVSRQTDRPLVAPPWRLQSGLELIQLKAPWPPKVALQRQPIFFYMADGIEINLQK